MTANWNCSTGLSLVGRVKQAQNYQGSVDSTCRSNASSGILFVLVPIQMNGIYTHPLYVHMSKYSSRLKSYLSPYSATGLFRCKYMWPYNMLHSYPPFNIKTTRAVSDPKVL